MRVINPAAQVKSRSLMGFIRQGITRILESKYPREKAGQLLSISPVEGSVARVQGSFIGIAGIKADEADTREKFQEVANFLGVSGEVIFNAPSNKDLVENVSALTSRSARNYKESARSIEVKALVANIMGKLNVQSDYAAPDLFLIGHSNGASLLRIALEQVHANFKVSGQLHLLDRIKFLMVAPPDNEKLEIQRIAKILGTGKVAQMADYEKDSVVQLQVKQSNPRKAGRLYKNPLSLRDWLDMRASFALNNPLAPLIKLQVAEKYLELNEPVDGHLPNHELKHYLELDPNNLLAFLCDEEVQPSEYFYTY